jgi:hypothetical protein
MTITYRGAVVRNIKSNSYYGYDIDATNYIRSVESADGQALETGVKDAINTFIVGCKTDGIWDAIKASCILAGARTLDGALVPLVGAAPTNNNFVSGDYNRETGLIGDDSTKYLNSNRNNNADPQDDNHQVVFLTKEQTVTAKFYIGAGTTNPGTSHIGRSTFLITRSRSSTDKAGTPPDAVGLLGISRNNSTTFTLRADGTSSVVSDSSQTPYDNDVLVFSVSNTTLYSNARIAFYSIGESLDLALLDTRVTSLMAQLAFAINTGLSPVGYSSETIDYVNAGYAAGGTLA